MVIVSACLAGMNCRYDGTNCLDKEIETRFRRGEAFPVCPEELGGLPTPRVRSEIQEGAGNDVLDGRSRVLNAEGEDVTSQFLRGARETLAIARSLEVSEGILKSRSPSCGVTTIRQKGRIVRGCGVTAALLLREGITLSER